MFHLKPVLVNSIIGIASLVGIAGTAGEMLPIPTEIIPTTHTTIEGILVALVALYIKNAPTKMSNDNIQKSINVACDTLGSSVAANSAGIKGLVEANQQQNLKLATWMGETTATIKYHGELIREIKDDIRGAA